MGHITTPALVARSGLATAESDAGREWSVGVPSDHLDRALMSRIAEGDHDAFAALFDTYHKMALWKATGLLRNMALAEEAVQEAFLSIWRSPFSFDLSRGTVSVWVMSLVRHRAIDVLRHEHALANRTRRESTDTSNQRTPTDPAEQVTNEFNDAERRHRLGRAVSELTPKQRGVVDLMYFSGLSQRGVSERLGLPLGTVKSRSLMAMRSLRQALVTESAVEPLCRMGRPS